MPTEHRVTATLDTDDMQAAIDLLTKAGRHGEAVALDNLRSHLRAEDAEAQRVASTHADPPKPTWPEGTIAWVTYTHAIDDGHPYQALAQYDAEENEWVMERAHTGAACTVTGDNVTTVEPLRVLGDQHVAVPVVTLRTDVLRSEAEEYAPDNPANLVAAVLNAYAEAVEDAEALDAEAGDRS